MYSVKKEHAVVLVTGSC